MKSGLNKIKEVGFWEGFLLCFALCCCCCLITVAESQGTQRQEFWDKNMSEDSYSSPGQREERGARGQLLGTWLSATTSMGHVKELAVNRGQGWVSQIDFTTLQLPGSFPDELDVRSKVQIRNIRIRVRVCGYLHCVTSG